jgi:hypothetical protein
VLIRIIYLENAIERLFMKRILTLVFTTFILLTTSANAGVDSSGGGTLFGHTGMEIQTIFQSPLVWRKIFGGVKKIALISRENKKATYRISTTEGIAKKNSDGITIGWDQVACESVITVENVAHETMVPKLEVTNVNFSKCPSVK